MIVHDGIESALGLETLYHAHSATESSALFARETQIMAWNEDLQRPEVVRDSERVRLIHQEIQAEQATIAQLYEHWEEANERNG